MVCFLIANSLFPIPRYLDGEANFGRFRLPERSCFVIAERQLSRHCERSEAISSAYKDCFAPFLPIGGQEGARNDERGCFAICYDENALLVGRIEPRRFLPVLSVRQAGGSLTAVRADRPLLALTSYQ